jgi:hypothetical protein
MKLNFNTPVLDIKGEPQKDLLSELLANMLMNAPAREPLTTQYFVWGLELHKTGVIEVDDAQIKTLKEFLGNPETKLTVLGKGRLDEVIAAAEKAADKKAPKP